jgi:nucleoid-associated protein YgaU
VGIVVVLIALALNFWLLDEDGSEPPPVATAPVTVTPTPEPQPVPQPQPEPAKSPEPQPESVKAPEPQPEPAKAPEAEAEPEPARAPEPAPPQPGETQTAEPAPAPAPPSAEPEPPTVILPTFDVVRVASTGDIVVAGRAAPGSVVTVYDDGRPIGQIKADGRGEWVMLPDEPLPPGSRELSLSSRLGDAEPVWSEKVVVIVVPELGLDVAGQPTDESSGALAVEVPRTGFGTSEVLQQPPAGEAPPLPTGGDIALSVDVLDYDEQGNLGLTGRANGNSNVVVYLDNGLLAAARAGSDGAWRIIVERPVAPGLYTLRVDEMAGGKVIARLEFPFQRADPKEIESETLLVVVQPGNSLWRLARRTLGEGTRYTVIYQANRERIRDPDLIYPGQVFEVPRTN